MSFENPVLTYILRDFLHPALSQTELDNTISLDAAPKALPNSGSWVTVTWEGVRDPSGTDFIAAYAVPFEKDVELEPSRLAPVKYQYAAYADPKHLESGSGQIKFRLVELSGDYRFGFFRGNITRGVLAAWSSDVVTVGERKGKKDDEIILRPLQLHLALTSKPSEMRVTWKTSGLEAPAADASLQVQYYAKDSGSPKDNSNWASSSATSMTFDKEDLCGEPAQSVGFVAPGYVHTAVMRGLAPATTYEYKVGGATQDVWSTTYSFRTGPAVAPVPVVMASAAATAVGNGQALASEFADAGPSVRIAMMADMSSAEEDGSLQAGWFANDFSSLDTSSLLLQQVTEDEIDLVMCIGDLSYSSGYLSRWDAWLDQVERVAASVPFMTTPGNHERDDPFASSFYKTATTYAANEHADLSIYKNNDGGGECGVPYQTYFPMPGPGEDPRGDQPWYSFKYGPVHVTVASTEHDFQEGSPQYAWLARDLAQVDRVVTPWLVFVGHRPFYVDSTEDPEPANPLSPSEQGAARLLRTHLEPLLLKHHVDLCLAGHHHSYQRTCKVADGECVAEAAFKGAYKAPVHAIVGMAGRRLSVNFETETPVYFESVERESWGTMVLEATPWRLVMTFRDSMTAQIMDQTILHVPLEHLKQPKEENDDEAYHKNRYLPHGFRHRYESIKHLQLVYWFLALVVILGFALTLGNILTGGRLPVWWLRLMTNVAGSGNDGGGGNRSFRDKHVMSPAPPGLGEQTPLTGSSLDGSGNASKRYRTGSIHYADAV
jgi:hypothetical protein